MSRIRTLVFWMRAKGQVVAIWGQFNLRILQINLPIYPFAFLGLLEKCFRRKISSWARTWRSQRPEPGHRAWEDWRRSNPGPTWKGETLTRAWSSGRRSVSSGSSSSSRCTRSGRRSQLGLGSTPLSRLFSNWLDALDCGPIRVHSNITLHFFGTFLTLRKPYVIFYLKKNC